MRFTTKLFLLFAGVLSLAVIGNVLALWGNQQARHHLTLTDLAHHSYQAHMSLSNHTYQLFKQFGDAMVIGDQDQGALETELLAAIRRDISRIRKITAAEIRSVDDDGAMRLDHVIRIEAKIQKLLDEYQTVLNTGYPIPLVSEWGRLSKILDESVDQDFARLIQEGLDREFNALVRQQALTEARLQFNQWLAVGMATFGALAGLAAMGWLVRDFQEPVSRLIHGAEALARGEHTHRIAPGGGRELAGIAYALNRMADEIADRQAHLEAVNRRLETTVSERTTRLEQLLVTLKEAENSRKRLLADVSHELRTPLTIIRGEAEIALRGADKSPEEYRTALACCRDAATHTARLVDDLLFIARREALQETRLRLTTVDLAQLAPAMIEGCRSLAGDREVAIRFQSDLITAPVRADADRLRQMLMILLDNAQRYGGAHIDVGLTARPGGYTLTVRDDGPGLPAEERERVFERFFRGNNAAQRYQAGVGLGLPVAKAIVEAHKGDMTLHSVPGQGVTVAVRLPDERSSGEET